MSVSVPDGSAWLAAAGITQADIRTMCVDWRANIIRLPFAQNHVLPPGTSAPASDYLAALDQVIEWAAQHGAYTILDLQRIDPGAGTPELTDASSLAMWRVLFDRYQDELGEVAVVDEAAAGRVAKQVGAARGPAAQSRVCHGVR